MPTAYDFHLHTSVENARAAVSRSLSDQGFQVAGTPNGSLLAKRGSLGLTLFVGALAGDKMHVTFDVQFLSDGDGAVARLNRSVAAGAIKGGALGASRAADTFQNTAHRLGVDLHQAQILTQTTEV